MGGRAKPSSVLHVIGTAELAGSAIANMVRVLARHLDPAEFELSACFLGASGPWTAALRGAGVAAFEVPWSAPADLPGGLRFWRFLRSRRWDLLHLHYGGRSVRLVARLGARAPLVVHAHGRVRSEFDYRPVPLHLRDADAVIATSRAVARLVEARRVDVVYPGVSLAPARAPAGLPGNSWILGAAGRLVPIKGHDWLLDAFAELLRLQPLARLEIAGDGPERSSLERRAERLGVAGAVTFLGWVEDLGTAMSRWVAFVQPSREEALGVAVLEAMAAGLPVVASAVGGLPELVESGVTGFCVPVGDVAALTAAMDRLMRDPVSRGAFGAAGRRVAASFGEPRFAREVARVYREVLAPERDAPAAS